MKRAVLLALALLVLSAGAASGASRSPPDSLLSVTLSPGFSLPLGDCADYFANGYGASLGACYRMPFFPLLYAGVDVGYWHLPLRALTSLSTFAGGLSAGAWFDLLPRLSVRGFVLAGYSYSFLGDGLGKGGAPYVGGGVDLSWAFVPTLSASVGASYRSFVDLYSDVVVRIGISYNFVPPERHHNPW